DHRRPGGRLRLPPGGAPASPGRPAPGRHGPRRPDHAGRPGGAGAPLAQGRLPPAAHLPGKRPRRLPDRPDRLSMRRLAEARRRREARGALARPDLPQPVRLHLSPPNPPDPLRRHPSTPKPPDRLPWRQVTYTVLDLETTGLDPTTDAIVSAGGLRVIGGRGAAPPPVRRRGPPRQRGPPPRDPHPRPAAR